MSPQLSWPLILSQFFVKFRMGIFGHEWIPSLEVPAYKVLYGYTVRVMLGCEVTCLSRVEGTTMMNKGNMKTICKHLLEDYRRTAKTAWARMLEFGVSVLPIRRIV